LLYFVHVKRHVPGIPGLLGVILATSVACGPSADDRQAVRAALQNSLTASAAPPFVTRDAEGRRLWSHARELYERRDHDPIWFRGTVPSSRVGHLIQALHAVREDGLDPDLYAVSALERWRDEGTDGFLIAKGLEPDQVGWLDPWLTYLYMKVASDLASGISDLAHADDRWRIRPPPFDPRAHLEDTLARSRVRAALLDLRPDTAQYRSLREALADYRAIAERGGWPRLPSGTRLARGQADEPVRLLAERLAASGDYTPSRSADAVVFDGDLQAALQRFQVRHGLAGDGVIGPATLAQLNVSVEHRIAQIELNLERWRWLPRDLGRPHILVNVPEYQLEVWEGSRVPLAMPVVVGRPDTPTPIFNHEMTYLVFSPYWNVPPGIAEGETLPAVMRDPAFLARNDMEVVDRRGRVIDPATIDPADPSSYRFRQRPGRQNSLGLVKFMFPNEHHVYLHDTPANSLFDRVSRPFSHGCVRVAEPKALAAYLLRDDREWPEDRIEQAMQAGDERTVQLRKPVPVYLGYWTARVAPDGSLQFRNDIYGIDRRQSALLADRLARLRKAAQAAAGAVGAGPR
jgi:L,D-transpeptidase YcbB